MEVVHQGPPSQVEGHRGILADHHNACGTVIHTKIRPKEQYVTWF